MMARSAKADLRSTIWESGALCVMMPSTTLMLRSSVMSSALGQCIMLTHYGMVLVKMKMYQLTLMKNDECVVMMVIRMLLYVCAQHKVDLIYFAPKTYI